MKLAETIKYAKDLWPTDRNHLQVIRFSRSSYKDLFICFTGDNGDQPYAVNLIDAGKPSERITGYTRWVPTTEELLADDWYSLRSYMRLCKGASPGLLILKQACAIQGVPVAMISCGAYNELKRECETFARQWQEHEDARLMEGTQESIKHLALKLVFGNRFDKLFSVENL